MSIENNWNWWSNALAGSIGPMVESEPQPGFYRTRQGKGGPWVAVAIWHDEDGLNVLRGEEALAGEEAYQCWVWSCRNPLTHEQYGKGVQGEWWDEVDVAPVEAVIGHNSAGVEEGLLDQIQTIIDAARAWVKEIGGAIATQEQADRAGTYANRLADAERKAEEAYRAQKDPLVAAGKEIDARWKPVVGAASEGKKWMKEAVGAFLLAKKRENEAAARRLSEETGMNFEAQRPKAGGAGRSLGLRVRKEVVCTDAAALLAHYVTDKRFIADAGVCKALLRLAEIDLKSDKPVPGVGIEERATAA